MLFGRHQKRKGRDGDIPALFDASTRCPGVSAGGCSPAHGVALIAGSLHVQVERRGLEHYVARIAVFFVSDPQQPVTDEVFLALDTADAGLTREGPLNTSGENREAVIGLTRPRIDIGDLDILVALHLRAGREPK